MPAMILSRVLLPEPLRPHTPKNSPGITSKLMSWSACCTSKSAGYGTRGSLALEGALAEMRQQEVLRERRTSTAGSGIHASSANVRRAAPEEDHGRRRPRRPLSQGNDAGPGRAEGLRDRQAPLSRGCNERPG